MDSMKPQDVLELWELTWGPLEEKWRTQFLKHPDMPAILQYSCFQIDIAIRRSKNYHFCYQY